MSEERPRFTVDDVMAAATAVVEEAGRDFVYNPTQCVYSNRDGTPSCIVGHIAQRLDPALFKAIADRERSSGGTEGVCWLESQGWIPEGTFSAEAESFLQTLQNWQDDRQSWGYSLDKALDTVL